MLPLLGTGVGQVSTELHIPERSALQSGRADSSVKSVNQSSDGVVAISVLLWVVVVDVVCSPFGSCVVRSALFHVLLSPFSRAKPALVGWAEE